MRGRLKGNKAIEKVYYWTFVLHLRHIIHSLSYLDICELWDESHLLKSKIKRLFTAFSWKAHESQICAKDWHKLMEPSSCSPIHCSIDQSDEKNIIKTMNTKFHFFHIILQMCSRKSYRKDWTIGIRSQAYVCEDHTDVVGSSRDRSWSSYVKKLQGLIMYVVGSVCNVIIELLLRNVIATTTFVSISFNSLTHYKFAY